MNWVAPANTGHLHVIGMSHESFDATLGSTRWERVQQLYRDVDLLLLLTEHDAARFELEGFNNVGVMHNSLSFYPDVASDVSAKVVVAAGRLAPEKGYDRLIDAFALGRRPTTRTGSLKIFGHRPAAGPARRSRPRRSGWPTGCCCPGWPPTSRPSCVDASVFALSSIHEGLPMALAEGMACGLACVAFDCAPGVREIVTDGVDGIVVPPAERRGPGRRAVPADGRRGAAAAPTGGPRGRASGGSPRTPVLAQWEGVFATVDR